MFVYRGFVDSHEILWMLFRYLFVYPKESWAVTKNFAYLPYIEDYTTQFQKDYPLVN